MVTELFTKKEAAERLNISQVTLDRHVARGFLQSTKIGRKRQFTEKHLNDFIKNGEV